MRKREIVEKLKNLDEFISNVSNIQIQLLSELGYEAKWINKDLYMDVVAEPPKKELILFKKHTPALKTYDLETNSQLIKVSVTNGITSFAKYFHTFLETYSYLKDLSQHQDFNFMINDGKWEKSKDIKS